MEAVPRMPMIWLELKEAGEFEFSPIVRQYIQRNYGENPENYNESLQRLEQCRQSAVKVSRDFEGCSTLRKYFGQLHFLQSRIPMTVGQEAAVPATWTDIFSGRSVTHEDISYEQACVLYNLGALHSFLGAVDNRVSEEGMKVSCTHFQCSAGAFSYIRDHYNHNYSSDMHHQALSINISLMLAQAQECLLEKSLLDNRKSFLIARICTQVCDYYKECMRVLDNTDILSGKKQKEWRKLISMKISYFSAIIQLHMGKQAEEQQKHGEAVAYFHSSMDKLNEAIKLSKGQPDSVQEALRFTMDVIGGKFNSAKKDNDFIYHETVPAEDNLGVVKGAPLVKPLPVSATDPSVTGPDLFAKLVPMATHEASSLYSEEKAKLLREVMAKIDSKNETLERFMDSLSSAPVANLDLFSSVPDALIEKCAALSVRPDTAKSLVQAMQALSGVYTDVGASLGEVQEVLEEDEAGERSLVEVLGGKALPPRPPALQEVQKELQKYQSAHQAASQTNTELHRAMNQHIPNLRLLQGPLEQLRTGLPQPQLSKEDTESLLRFQKILGKVDEMRQQRRTLEGQLRELIHKDDITAALVTTERADMKRLFEEQLKKYDQLKGYIDQNLVAQDNILRALTDANVQCATVRKTLAHTEQQWNSSVQSLIGSFEAFEDLMKKAEEGREFYQDLDRKTSAMLSRAKTLSQTREQERMTLLEREIGKTPPARPTAQKPLLSHKVPDTGSGPSSLEDLPQELRSVPPNMAQPGSYGYPHFPPHLPPNPLTCPPGAAMQAKLPLTNPAIQNSIPPAGQRMGPTLPHPGSITPFPYAQGPYAPSTGTPNLPAQLHPAGPHYTLQPQSHPRPLGPSPNHPQLNQSNAIHGYGPGPWQQAPGGPFPVVSGGYVVPPQMGQFPPNLVRPGLPPSQVPVPRGPIPQSSGQQMPPRLPASSNQPFPPGTQHLSSIPQGAQVQGPRGPLPGQSQVPFNPSPSPAYQSSVPAQPGQPPVFRPGATPQTQPHPGLAPQPGAHRLTNPQGATIPGQAPAHIPPGPMRQPHPGLPLQNQPLHHMGYVPPGSQPQMMPPHHFPPGVQANAQIPFSQACQMPFNYPYNFYNPAAKGLTSQHQMPPGSLPPQGNVYSQMQSGHQQQPQGNAMFYPAGAPIVPPHQLSNAAAPYQVPQPDLLSGPATALDIPNSTILAPASAPIPTSAPQDNVPQNQIPNLSKEPNSSSLEYEGLEIPNTTMVSDRALQQMGLPSTDEPLPLEDAAVNQVSLQDKMGNLSLAPQGEAAEDGLNGGQGSEVPDNSMEPGQPAKGPPEPGLNRSEHGNGIVHQPESENGFGEISQDMASANGGADVSIESQDEVSKKNPLNDLDPLWNLH